LDVSGIAALHVGVLEGGGKEATAKCKSSPRTWPLAPGQSRPIALLSSSLSLVHILDNPLIPSTTPRKNPSKRLLLKLSTHGINWSFNLGIIEPTSVLGFELWCLTKASPCRVNSYSNLVNPFFTEQSSNLITKKVDELTQHRHFNKNQGFTILSITKNTSDSRNIYISVDYAIIKSYMPLFCIIIMYYPEPTPDSYEMTDFTYILKFNISFVDLQLWL
jgi:hypothetical protein